MVDLGTLRPGQVETVGNLVFGRCCSCLRVVRMNRPFFGSRHYCEPAPAIDADTAWRIEQQARAIREPKRSILDLYLKGGK